MKLNDRLLAWFDSAPLVSEMLAQWSDRGRGLFAPADAGPVSERLIALAEMALSRKGEVSGAIIAEAFLDLWRAADAEARSAFMCSLLYRFGPDAQRLSAAAADYLKTPDAAKAHLLHDAAEPTRQELLRRINFGNRGTATIVAMREHLLDMLPDEPELVDVDADFRHLFNSWFNRGFLTVRSIGWNSPANILESLIRYEAVHEIDGWDDLRRRLAPEDRRCFGFFHPQMPDEPLIFVEVALTDGIPDSVGQLLASDREPIPARNARTAVFYSISNCQRGLAGISLGNFLIKQVVKDLRAELKNLDTFVTLSPIPGFAAWLLRNAPEDPQFRDERRLVADLVKGDAWADGDAAELARIRDLMMPLAACYLTGVRRGDGKPRDPVARFHLGNGAQLERLNFLGDRSRRGLRQSFGMMVNYIYRPSEIERNHELYAEMGHVAASPQVKRLTRNKRTGVAG